MVKGTKFRIYRKDGSYYTSIGKFAFETLRQKQSWMKSYNKNSKDTNKVTKIEIIKSKASKIPRARPFRLFG